MARQPEKVFLGKLAKYRGKLVDDVLHDSVTQYLEHSTFNGTRDVKNLLEALGFSVARYEPWFPTIQKMIYRRHEIVHRADAVKVAATERQELQTIEVQEVDRWVLATHYFVYMVLGEQFTKINSRETLERRLKIRITP